MPNSQQIFLGVDGGGTKTHLVLINQKKEKLCEGFSGPSNPLRVGAEVAISNIEEAFISACDSISLAPIDISAAVFGLAGTRREDIKTNLAKRLTQQLNIKKTQILTDAEIALFATTQGKTGLVIISGTGSVCFGQDSKGNTAMAGGWGPIAGDEGGGITIAKQGLQAIAKALDGRGKHTDLCEIGAKYFRASNPEDLIVAIYSPQTDNKKIAGFARHVIETARKGDEIAIEILAEAGFELGIAAYAVIKKLKLSNKKIPIGTVGSIFKAGKLITTPLIDTVKTFTSKAYLQKPKLTPAKAAAIMALNLSKKTKY